MSQIIKYVNLYNVVKFVFSYLNSYLNQIFFRAKEREENNVGKRIGG